MEHNSKYFKSSKVRERSRDYIMSTKQRRRETSSGPMRKRSDSGYDVNKNEYHTTHERHSSSNWRNERKYNHRQIYYVQDKNNYQKYHPYNKYRDEYRTRGERKFSRSRDRFNRQPFRNERRFTRNSYGNKNEYTHNRKNNHFYKDNVRDNYQNNYTKHQLDDQRHNFPRNIHQRINHKTYEPKRQSRSFSNCRNNAFTKQHEKHRRDHELHRRHSYKKEFPKLRNKSYSYSERSLAFSRRNRSYSSSSSSSSNKSSEKDLGHYNYMIGNILNEKYKIEEFLGDGTFGRVLECRNVHDNETYAVKVIRPVKRYIESAKIEAETIIDIMRKDFSRESHCVSMLDYFYFEDESNRYIALVFEKLGKSLYDFIKMNKYRGFPMHIIQEFARQILQGIGFLHEKMELTHTDLKPENLLFKNSAFEVIHSKQEWPKHILKKEKRIRSVSPSTRSYSGETKEKEDHYFLPLFLNLKIIDFGGATYKTERHSEIINTRQYRAPEVILGCCEWDEKSDIWSIACILVELYTGELFFPTHNNEEHLCLIEKISGAIPHWMADNCRKEFARIFYLDKPDSEIQKIGHRINYNKLSKKEERIEAVKDLDTLDEIIIEEHSLFKEFIKSLLIIDPTERPSCKESLKHVFFKCHY